MRVLMVSPHPVYSPRGTPISVFNRCLALCALDHQVDLVTYPVGEDRQVEGLRYLRAAMPGVRSVPVGPSLRKLVLNGAVTLRSLREAVRGKGTYDVVHTHEEAGVFGPALARLAQVPHVYDMGNDWADVLGNYGLAERHPLTRVAGAFEDAVIRRSDAVIAHFPLIANRVESVSSTPVETVFNISLEPEPDPAVVSALREAWTADGTKVVLYTGTLESYQGIPLLLEAMAQVSRAHPSAVLVILGGREAQVQYFRQQARALGIASRVRLEGAVPAPLVPACMQAADVLVSPRELGNNTPLKIFSYLRSGRPIVATDILSHTQVLDRHTCVLVPPTAAGLADGIGGVLDEGPSRRRVDQGAQAVRTQFGIEQYVSGVSRAYRHVGGGGGDAGSIGRAAERINRATAGNDVGPEYRRALAALLEPSLQVAV
jgi:glycosyltransferase involved in cell wall biosynthesis